MTRISRPALRPRPRAAQAECGARLDAGGRQSGAGRRAIRRAGAVRQGDRRAVAAGRGGFPGAGPPAAGLARLRAVHDRLRHGGCVVRRQAGASPPAGRAVGLFRARSVAADRVPRRHAFRPRAQGDAERHRLAVGPLGRLLPRPPVGLRVVPRPPSPLSVPELEIGCSAHCPLHLLRRGHVLRAAQDRRDAGRSGGALFGACRARLRHARQCRAGAQLLAHRRRGARSSHRHRQAAGGADSGAVVVGGGERSHARRHHADGAVDHRARRLAQYAGPRQRRRDRHLHELCRLADRPAAEHGQFRQSHLHRGAAARRFLPRAGHRLDHQGPAGRDRSRASCAARSNSAT